MSRRDELTFRQEMKFRNKLVEYLTDWIMGNPHQLNVQGDVSAVSRYVSRYVSVVSRYVSVVSRYVSVVSRYVSVVFRYVSAVSR